MIGVLHAAAGVAALACALVSAVALSARRGHADVRGTLPLAALGAAAWCANVTSFEVSGLDPWSQLLWLPSAGFTAGALTLWAGRLSTYGWTPPRWLVVAWLVEPLLVVVVRVVVGTDVVVEVDRPVVVFGPLFLVHSAYCFGLLVTTVILLARRRHDPSPSVRAATVTTMAGATGALVAEALRLQLTDVVVTVALVVLTALVVRRPADFVPRPDPESLLDDLGALVFVFDDHQRLVDLNGPARLFYALRQQPVPAPGTPAPTLFGHTLDDPEARVVQLGGPGQGARMSGYSHRLPSDGSPPRGWVTLLRRSRPEPVAGARPDARDDRRSTMGRLAAYDPETGLVTARSLQPLLATAARELPDDEVAVVVVAADGSAARALGQTWERRADCLVVARLDAGRVVVVLRTDGRTRDEIGGEVRSSVAGSHVDVAVGRLGAAGSLVRELEARGSAPSADLRSPGNRSSRS